MGVGISRWPGASLGSVEVRVAPLSVGAPACAGADVSLPVGEAHPTRAVSAIESKRGAVKCCRKPVMS